MARDVSLSLIILLLSRVVTNDVLGESANVGDSREQEGKHMASLSPEMGLQAQDGAIRAAATALHAVIPSGGDRVEHRGLYLMDMSDTETVVVMADGGRKEVPASPDVAKAFAELRRVMYKPGVGTWFSVAMTVSAEWEAETQFSYDDNSVAGRRPSGIAFLTDLQTYPIDEDKRPEWLKRYVAEGVEELIKNGRSSYPKWLKKMTRFGRKPSWLNIVPEKTVPESAVPEKATPEKEEAVISPPQSAPKRRWVDSDSGIEVDKSNWTEVLSASLGKMMTNTKASERLVSRGRDWFCDFDRGTLAFGDDEFPVQFLGSEAYERNTWLWGWRNINNFPDNVVSFAHWVRQIGIEWNLEPLTTVSFDLTSELNGINLSVVACSICEQNVCFYGGHNSNGGRFFMVYSGLPDEVFAPIGTMEFIQTTMQAIGNFSLDHPIFVKSFLYQNGTPYDEEGDTIVAHFDQDVRITFKLVDGFRCISNIKAAMGGEEPPRA